MYSARKLLSVGKGSVGLRQSDALFLHTVQLSELVQTAAENLHGGKIAAVAASDKPREAEGSYMPCFLAGKSHAETASALLGVPCFLFSHQQGHIAAGAWSAGRTDLLEKEFLALHVSGGTTEILHVLPDQNGLISASRIGGSADLAAGQLVDRCGQMLGLGFPAGPEIEKLALGHTSESCFVPKSEGLEFSLSGLENKIRNLQNSGELSSNIAYFVIKSITEVLCLAIGRAVRMYPDMPILCVGGVMSNGIIRTRIQNSFDAVFAKPEYSSDNAAGIAYLAASSYAKGGYAFAR
jgi:N6-L-threonylcarbamoyladenine synthase